MKEKSPALIMPSSEAMPDHAPGADTGTDTGTDGLLIAAQDQIAAYEQELKIKDAQLVQIQLELEAKEQELQVTEDALNEIQVQFDNAKTKIGPEIPSMDGAIVELELIIQQKEDQVNTQNRLINSIFTPNLFFFPS
jgi:hypothetical protein